jgi:hypothetical protein
MIFFRGGRRNICVFFTVKWEKNDRKMGENWAKNGGKLIENGQKFDRKWAIMRKISKN